MVLWVLLEMVVLVDKNISIFLFGLNWGENVLLIVFVSLIVIGVVFEGFVLGIGVLMWYRW